MNIVLSGGDLGGQEIEWPEGQEVTVVDGLRYKLVGDCAVFDGTHVPHGAM